MLTLMMALALTMIADQTQSGFKTEAEAATAALIQSVKMDSATELTGVIYSNHGLFYYTKPVGTGQTHEVNASEWHVLVPQGSILTGSYHTHPTNDEYAQYFSQGDMDTYHKTHLTGYVGVVNQRIVIRFDGQTQLMHIGGFVTSVGLGTKIATL